MRCKSLFAASFIITLSFMISKTSAQDTLNTSSQLKEILAEKKLRTMTQKKIDSQLLQAIRANKENGKPAQNSLEPVNVNADKDGNLKVDIKAEVTDLLINKIKTLGGTIIYASKEYRTFRATVNLSMIEQIAAYPDVRFIEPAAIPHHNTNSMGIKPAPWNKPITQ